MVTIAVIMLIWFRRKRFLQHNATIMRNKSLFVKLILKDLLFFILLEGNHGF